MKKAVYIVGAGLVIGGAATIYMLNMDGCGSLYDPYR